MTKELILHIPHSSNQIPLKKPIILVKEPLYFLLLFLPCRL